MDGRGGLICSTNLGGRPALTKRSDDVLISHHSHTSSIPLSFFGHTTRADPSLTHSRALRANVAPLPRVWDCRSGITLGSLQLNPTPLLLTSVWQLLIIEHRIDSNVLLDIRRPGVLRLCASCLEQPPTVHKTYLFHGRLLIEFEILSVFTRFLTHVFNLFTVFYVFIFTRSAPLLRFVSFTVP